MEYVTLLIQQFGPWACLVGVVAWFMWNENQNRTERKETLAAHEAEVNQLRLAYEANTKVLTELATLLKSGDDGK